MDITFHYPPDLFNLLVETIPRLCRSKKDTVLFFKGAGINAQITEPFLQKIIQDRDSIKKFEIVQSILTTLNEKGEATLRERREVLKRVNEFEDFSACYPNDQLIAEGLVARVRSLINKKDSFTRMTLEVEKERKLRLEEKNAESERKRQKLEELNVIHKDLISLFGETNSQKTRKVTRRSSKQSI
jgi:restriction system protein